MINTRSRKKYRVRTPGGRTVIHSKGKKHSAELCRSCGAKLNRAKMTFQEFARTSKSGRRPQRPYPYLCSSCMRIRIKEIARQ
jgi:large subunit ribosomal protein L34e